MIYAPASGERVIYSEVAGAVSFMHVTATHNELHESTLDVTIDGEVVHTTDEHPFFVIKDGEGEWVKAKDLQVGDVIFNTMGQDGIVGAVEVVDEPQLMYNLSVQLVASYFVGDGQWLVHNVDIALGRNRAENPDSSLGRHLLQPFAESVNALPFQDWNTIFNREYWSNNWRFGDKFHHVARTVILGGDKIKFNLENVNSWSTRQYQVNNVTRVGAEGDIIPYTEWELVNILHNAKYYDVTEFYYGRQRIDPADLGEWDLEFRGCPT